MLLVAGCATAPVPPPDTVGAEPFYAKYVDARGVPILSSSRVSDEALLAARDMARDMLSYRPELAEWLAAND